jgi:alkylhydroperoxidase/carboxymuconolactone decarboxylase family protein
MDIEQIVGNLLGFAFDQSDIKTSLNELTSISELNHEVTMSHYYEENDLERFDEIGKYRPDLYDIFMNYYQGVMSAGALSVREKALIALAVAHAVQCPYCIDAYTRGSLEAGSNLEEMTEAIHVAAAIRGGATLIHGIQVHNAAAKITL